MHYEPRTIALQTEVVHPPQAPDARAVQAIHNEMFSSPQPAWASFQVGAEGGPVLSNPATHPGHVSQAVFLPDRLAVREEQSAATLDEFAERCADLAGRYAKARGLGVFLAQVVTQRALVNVHHHTDTRRFLAEDVLHIAGDLTTFSRPAATVGLRLAFTSASADQPAVGVRVESYNADPRSLFLEVQATYGPAVAPGAVDAVRQRILQTGEILEREVLPFVARHDRALP